MNRTDSEKQRWISVQIMRGFAAVLVAAYHFEDQLMIVFGYAAGGFGPLSWFGFFGVDLFFVTSGFVIWPMMSKANALFRDRLNFIVGRALRIYVPYLTVLSVVIYFGLGSGQADVAKSIMLYPQRISMQLLPVAWTLVYEVLFYIVAFGIMFVADSRHRYYVLAAIVIVFVLKAIIVIATNAASFYDYNAFLVGVTYNRWVDGLLFGYLTSLWFVEFFAGVTISYLLSRGYSERILQHAMIIWAAAVVWLSVAIYISVNIYGVSMTRGDMFVPRIILFGGAASLIFLAAIATEMRAFINVFPKTIVDFFVWLGNGSYSIYLIHTVAFGVAYNYGFRDWCASNDLIGGAAFVAYFFVVVLLSACIGNYVELPVHKKLLSLTRPRVRVSLGDL